MRIFDVIKKKRDGQELTTEEINYFINGYLNGEIADYQISALLMAIYYKGMSDRETADLTFAIRDSGKKLDFSNIDGIRVDKHSTGGVGDKTSLVVAPIVASLGVKVAKMSGRGLGHTGGTVDKLEAIPGFKTDLSEEDFIKIVQDVGIAIVGQNKELAPADKKLYELRDVTATIDSLPLIVSSIMGKKLAADDDCIILDVKTGSGAFCKTLEDSKKLAVSMVNIGKRAGKKIRALITEMDRPLGTAIGNSLEVIEAVNTLNGHGPDDFTEICITLAAHILNLAEKGTFDECVQLVKNSIEDKSALNTLIKMVGAQGGDVSVIKDVNNFKKAKYSYVIKSNINGYISKVDAEGYGIASLLLGAGRNKIEDEIDSAAGIILCKKTGDYVSIGDDIAILYSSNEEKFEKSEQVFLQSTIFSDEKPDCRPLILGIIE